MQEGARSRQWTKENVARSRQHTSSRQKAPEEPLDRSSKCGLVEQFVKTWTECSEGLLDRSSRDARVEQRATPRQYAYSVFVAEMFGH